jgi:hypothetical protein
MKTHKEGEEKQEEQTGNITTTNSVLIIDGTF